MNKDIKIENDENVFNYRIAIVIKNNSKILVQKDDKVSHITLPGGRCELGETSIETSIREFKEETGIDIKYLRSIGMIENFFTSSFNNKKYHEILLINEMEFIKKDYYNKDEINNIEEKKKEHLKYIWIDENELKVSDFRPELLIDLLDRKDFQYIINRD
jgi:8-oxo-dGTP pyrophosphatase MutT (NUDIX family)